MLKIPFAIFCFLIWFVVLPYVEAQTNEPEISLKSGQWVKYRPAISSSDGYNGELKGVIEPMVDKLKDDFEKTNGFDIDKTIWIKYTVSEISGSIVTFDRSVLLTPDQYTLEQYKNHQFKGLLNKNMKIDTESLDKIYEKKLEPIKFDLTEFNPSNFFVMPTNLEFGRTFQGGSGLGVITFSSISDFFNDGKKYNVFSAHKITEQDIKFGVVTNTLEFDTLANYEFDMESGILLSKNTNMAIWNLNTNQWGYIEFSVTGYELSDNLEQNNTPRKINDRQEILEDLSFLFVETTDSRYLIENPTDSMGEPKRTTFDIINTKDGSLLGSFIMYGDDTITKIKSSTIYSGPQEIAIADDLHYYIRHALVPDCCGSLPTYAKFWSDPDSEGYPKSETIGNVKIDLGWVETDSFYNMGIFEQQIIYLDEDQSQQVVSQDNVNTVEVEQDFVEVEQEPVEGGGCLIATAAYGTELAVEVQNLREIRNKMYETGSGGQVMRAVNDFYYSFSPTVSDWQRQNPVFKEIMRFMITPSMASFTIIDHNIIESEEDLVSYVVSVAMLNAGIYFGIPVLALMSIRKKLKNNL